MIAVEFELMRAGGRRGAGWLFALAFALGATTSCGRAVRHEALVDDAAGPAGASGLGSGGSGGSQGGSAGSAAAAGVPVGVGGASEVPAALTRLLARVCTTPDCVAGLDFEVLRVSRGIQAGRLSIDPDAVDRCLAVLPTAFVFDSRTGVPPPECDALWIPLTPVGGACDTDFACIDGFCARSSYARSRPEYAAGGCGVCVPRGELGAPCSGHGWTGADRECAADLHCGCADGTDNCDTTCQSYTLAGAGEPCVAPHVVCAAILACAYEPSTGEGTCRTPLGPGASCTSSDVCRDATCLDLDASGIGHCGPRRTGEACSGEYDCAEDSFCDGGRCAPAVEGTPCAFPGAACSDDSVCAGRCLPRAGHGEACESELQCEEGDECLDGVCGTVLGLGAACDPPPTPVDRCASGTTCLAGRCTALGLGDACSTECTSGLCENGLCVSRAPGVFCAGSGAWGGDPCGPGVECGSGTCEARPARGEPCTADGYCDSGDFCNDSATCEEICVLDIPSSETR